MEPRVPPISESGGSVEEERDREIGPVGAIALGAGTMVAGTIARSDDATITVVSVVDPDDGSDDRERARDAIEETAAATGQSVVERELLEGDDGAQRILAGTEEPRRDHRRSDAAEPNPTDRLRGDSKRDRSAGAEYYHHDQAADWGDRAAGREGPAVGRRELRLGRGRPVAPGPRRRLSSWSTN